MQRRLYSTEKLSGPFFTAVPFLTTQQHLTTEKQKTKYEERGESPALLPQLYDVTTESNYIKMSLCLPRHIASGHFF